MAVSVSSKRCGSLFLSLSMTDELLISLDTRSKNATNILGIWGSLNVAEPTGGVYNTDRICIPEEVIKMLHGCLVHVGGTLTDLQIWDCE